MEDSNFTQDQNHPLYSLDRDNVDRLLGEDAPESKDFIELARLILRYDGFPGASDLQEDLTKVLRAWGLTHEELNERVRHLWAQGYRPGSDLETSVGSGFDTSDGDSS